jgi:hypothetical protein
MPTHHPDDATITSHDDATTAERHDTPNNANAPLVLEKCKAPSSLQYWV